MTWLPSPISRLYALALLFGADNARTRAGYGDLFTAWQSSGQAREVREKLRMVASMVPDTVHHSMNAYLDSFRARAYECFAALYRFRRPVAGTVLPVPDRRLRSAAPSPSFSNRAWWDWTR
jgi:hypothetical protein